MTGAGKCRPARRRADDDEARRAARHALPTECGNSLLPAPLFLLAVSIAVWK
jgi:hypothetical protein